MVVVFTVFSISAIVDKQSVDIQNHLMASFQDNLGKQLLECKTTLRIWLQNR